MHNGGRSGLGHCRGPLSKYWGRKVGQTAPTHGVNSKADDSDTQHHSDTLGLLSFRGPSPSNTKAGRQKGNVDEAAFLTQSNFRQRQHTSNIGPVDSRTWSKRGGSEKTEGQQGHDWSTEPQKASTLDKTHSRLKAGSPEATSKSLSLKEALELFRPDFISRSQDRVRRLEQRAMRRRVLQDSNPDLVQGLREDRCKQKRNCTTPDPLSDNLFKPRERSISGREMQLRSRRIYNKLPEVTKKKEEEKKKAVSQTNRLRAEVFKKRLLDQILQR
ncbi:(E2-independent) E3 ubiquitin-conjugating enzyme FATS-like [Chaetodon trifascialis]|uniref:(E2-independent) E3 ubiquitin-conjugating enzyme FATS-like n=1 Tax=Chaetodon trifascialis TaxID=109706 RepID=UPI0039937674